MSEETDDRERIITMEVEMRHLTVKVNTMSRQVTEMHDLMMKMRGAQWVALGLMGLVGFLSAKATWWFK